MNLSSSNYLNKKIFIYGLGKTGLSTLNFLKKKGNEIICWDDQINVRKKINKQYLLKSKRKISKYFFDYIVLSPGIDKKTCDLKKFLYKNERKIITDLDIFYSFNHSNKIISITGTNGKSTTCKLLYDIFKYSGYNAQLGGNIGKPVLSLKETKKKKSIFIIELSSYQLDYTKYFRPNYAAILNISFDHIERHKTINKYIKSKINIFKFQKKNDIAYLNYENQYFNKIYKNFRDYLFKSKIKKLKLKNINKYITRIKNKYLLTKNNLENLLFVIEISRQFRINVEKIIRVLNKFEGLPHRQEQIYLGKKFLCINDSKATSFEASIHSLNSYKNVFWILGGMPKKMDKFKFNNLNKNIIKAYIISQYSDFFIQHIKKKINYAVCKNLPYAFSKLIKDLITFKKKNLNYTNITLLFSPAAASFDKFKNFEQRGDYFKKLFKLNKHKLINA